MTIVLIIMVISSVIFVGTPLLFNVLQLHVPEYINTITGAYIGAVFAVIGSIVFQNIMDKKTNVKLFEKKKELIKKELYNNYLLAMKRVTEENVALGFSDDAYIKFVEDGDALDSLGEIEMFNEFSKLYFILNNGDAFCMVFDEFYEETFLKNKKNSSDYFQVYSILQSVGIDSIYELSIIRNIIRLNQRFELNLDLPCEMFLGVLNYHTKDRVSLEDGIIMYFTELVYQRLIGIKGKVYILEHLDNIQKHWNHKGEFLCDKSSMLNPVSKELAENKEFIKEYIDKKKSVLGEYLADGEVIQFISSFKHEDRTTEHCDYQKNIRKLESIMKYNQDVYLSFIGIRANEDAIDNYGRSRQQEFINGISKEYTVSERGWYREAAKGLRKGEEVVVTHPYRDTSGSYVISIVKVIQRALSEDMGAVGIDVLAMHMYSQLKCKYMTFLVTDEGEVVFNSNPNIKEILEERLNINYILEPHVFHEISVKGAGYVRTKMYNQEYEVYYDKVINENYFIMKFAECGKR